MGGVHASLFSEAWDGLEQSTRSVIEDGLKALATKQANERYGHFGQGWLRSVEIFAALGTGRSMTVHFIFDVQDAVVPQTGSDYWMHRIFEASAEIDLGVPDPITAHRMREWRSILVEEANEETYDWAGAFETARARCEELLRQRTAQH